MACQKCGADHLLSVSGKCSDMFSARQGAEYYDGYVLHEIGIGGGDNMEFTYCLDCGQIQGKWPKKFDPKAEQE